MITNKNIFALRAPRGTFNALFSVSGCLSVLVLLAFVGLAQPASRKTKPAQPQPKVTGTQAPVAKAPGRPPNILFLLSDDQRVDTIRALGNSQIRTPTLDRLVNEGTTFMRAYCMGAQQGAVCVPSRAMILSGQSYLRIPENLAGVSTWPQLFAKAGYTTYGIGKWHNGEPSFIQSFQSGKSIFFGGMSDPYTMQVQDLNASYQLSDKRKVAKHATAQFADTAIEFLREQANATKPFVLYTAFTLPHDPRVAPPDYHKMYQPAQLNLPANFLPQHPFENGELLVRDERLAPWPRTPEIVRQHLADYYATITYLDAQIARILETLKQTGQAENTIIVFAGDSGLAVGSHGLFGKQSVYEHSMNAPLIMAGPGIAKGKRSNALTYLLDLFPTLCELAGLKAPAGLDGQSLVPVLTGKRVGHRSQIFLAYRQFQRAIRTDRYKLIVYPQVNKTQLFDLVKDPAEMNDLAEAPWHEATRERLLKLLREAQAEFGDKQSLRVTKPAPLEVDFSKVEKQ